MLAAMAQAGRHGVFGEPAAAAGIAGVKVAVERGIIGRERARARGDHRQRTQRHRIAMKAVGQPIEIEADLEAVAAGLESFAKITNREFDRINRITQDANSLRSSCKSCQSC